jgi:hypothetical protein
MQERLGTDDRDNVHNRWKPATNLDEKQTVAVRELNPTPDLAAQHDQLMSEHHILGFKPALRLNGNTKMANTNQNRAIIASG